MRAQGRCELDYDEFLDCPDYELDESTELPSESDEQTEPVSPEEPSTADARGRLPFRATDSVTEVHSGEALTDLEASAVMRSRRTIVVVPVGDSEVGKTTLLTAMYECLSEKGLGGWSFVESRSLIGFEARSFHASADSGRLTPTMPRTSLNSEGLYLHLSVRNAELGRRDILLADISGEYFAELRNFNEIDGYEAALRSASSVMLMIDGERLSDPATRHTALTEARVGLRAISESGVCRVGTQLLVIGTKWDLCTWEAAEDELTRFAEASRQLGFEPDLFLTSARAAGGKPTRNDLAAVFDRLLRVSRSPRLPLATHQTGSRAAHQFRGASILASRFAVRSGE